MRHAKDKTGKGSPVRGAFGRTLIAGLALALAVGAGMLGANAHAAVGDWSENEQGRVRLIAADEGAAGNEVRLALHFDLKPGWKIYWRSPGDAGLPPRVDWSGSRNLADAGFRWPLPHRFELFGLTTFGYGGEVVLPVIAEPQEPDRPIMVGADLKYLTCSDICVPQQAKLSLFLPAKAGGGSGADGTAEARLIQAALSQVPDGANESPLRLERAVLTGSPEEPGLRVTARAPDGFQKPDILIEGPPGFTFGKPSIQLANGGHKAVFEVPVERRFGEKGVLEGKPLTLTVADMATNEAMETTLLPRHTAAAGGGFGAGLGAGGVSLLGVLGLALLGGLILNLMPCVLPVLSLKLLSAVSHGGRASGEVRISFLASAAGIVFSFLVLAGVALMLKQAGLAVGWGIQFQQPVFLAAMAVIVMLFAYNLFGLFEITLPGSVSDAAARTGDGAPQSATGDRGRHLGKAFLTGAFATLLATPCSAPFLGTAVAFALARGAAEILLIFTALGLGLALPYLLVAAYPRLATRLPRPGRWMVTLRRILGVALAATGLWLLSVLFEQSGILATLIVAAALIGIGAVLWVGRHQLRAVAGATPAAVALLAALALASPAFLSDGATARGEEAGGQGDMAKDGWQPLDEAEIARLVDAGKVVFVDVTADWCITCQVNKKLVIDSEAVRARLDSEAVVPMRGDWTTPDERIARYLRGFDRYGIPFNAVYGPAAPGGIALPEILSKDAVLRAMDKAAAGDAAAAAPSPDSGDGG